MCVGFWVIISLSHLSSTLQNRPKARRGRAGQERCVLDLKSVSLRRESVCSTLDTLQPAASGRGCCTRKPLPGVVRVIEIFQQLGRSAPPISPFQQKRDAGAEEDERPDPMGVDVDHAHAREQEHDATDQK